MAVLVLRKAVNTNVSVVKKSKNAARTEEKPENGDEKGAEIKPKSTVLQTSSVAPVANKAPVVNKAPGADKTPLTEAKSLLAPILCCKRHTGSFGYSTKVGLQAHTPAILPTELTGPQAWSCCGKPFNSPPCWGRENHDEPVGTDEVLEKRWKYHHTPTTHQASHRLAITIDMESELIRVTVIDYFTGERLVNNLVFPDIKIKHYNTRWSGITQSQMNDARQRGQCLLGMNAARTAVFKFAGPSTIVVGHSVGNDLSSLRWIHHNVVDTQILETERRTKEEAEKEQAEKDKEDAEKGAEEGEPSVQTEKGIQGQNGDKKLKGKEADRQNAPPKTPKGKYNPEGISLKALTMKRLGRAIQTGKNGHDSFEDALATRDLLHYHITTRL